MRTGVMWAKAVGAVVAAAGAVGIVTTSLAGRDAAALTWFWVWVPGAAVWLIGELVEPSPGYRFSSRPPFLQRRTVVADLGPEAPGRAAARQVLRVAFGIHSVALLIYVVLEIASAV